MVQGLSHLKDFKAIYEESFDPLCRQANRILNDSELSRDCVQKVFVKLWSKKEELNIQSNIHGYLSRAVKNAAISEYRKNKSAQNNEGLLKNKYLLWHQDDVTTSEDQQVIRKSLQKSFNDLKPKMRDIFLMHYTNGLTQLEIADTMNISKRTVEDNLARAYKILKEKLTNDKDFMNSRYVLSLLILVSLLSDPLITNLLQINFLKDVILDLTDVIMLGWI